MLFRSQVRRLRAIVDSARPNIRRLVAEAMTTDREEPISQDRIRGWREQANIKAARDAGFAYDAYVRLKLASARDFVARLIMEVRGVRPESPFARSIAEIMNVWERCAPGPARSSCASGGCRPRSRCC